MNNRQFNREVSNKNKNVKKNNLKPLIFTFLGTFIVFFFAFTVLLPILTPQVDIPALSDEHSLNSVTSNDFKGRLDPRLNSIEQEENVEPPKLKMELTKPNSQKPEEQSVNNEQKPDETSTIIAPEEPQDSVPGEDNWDYGMDNKAPDNTTNTAKPGTTPPLKSTTKTTKPVSIANIPPRPTASAQYRGETAKPITMTKVILGSYSTPMQARLVSDTLIEMDLNVTPFIKEKNGRYILQVGSFSDPVKAESLVQELKNKSFDAKVVNE